MNHVQTKKGFTIIEVVLVLAIAGLIFLMVFIALPQLQRSQRDGQRKEDLSRINTQINSYQSNNRGGIPTSNTALTSFAGSYLTPTTEYEDPQSGPYTISYQTNVVDSTLPAIGTILYRNGAVCDTDGKSKAGGARNYTLRMQLEGQKVAYCMSNQ